MVFVSAERKHRFVVGVGDVNKRILEGEKMSKQGTLLRQKRRQMGLCVQCGNQAEKGKSRCSICLAKSAESRRRYVARMTPDERERMYAKEIMRQKMARDMAVEVRHMKYIEEVNRLERKDIPKVSVKLTGLAEKFLKEGSA